MLAPHIPPFTFAFSRHQLNIWDLANIIILGKETFDDIFVTPWGGRDGEADADGNCQTGHVDESEGRAAGGR